MTFYDLFVHVECGSSCLEIVSFCFVTKVSETRRQIAGLDLRCLLTYPVLNLNLISLELFPLRMNVFVTFDFLILARDCVICKIPVAVSLPSIGFGHENIYRSRL